MKCHLTSHLCFEVSYGWSYGCHDIVTGRPIDLRAKRTDHILNPRKATPKSHTDPPWRSNRAWNKDEMRNWLTLTGPNMLAQQFPKNWWTTTWTQENSKRLPQDLEAQPEPCATAFTCSTIFLRHSSCLASEGMEPRGMHVGAASDRSELVKVILS